ncbi:QRFP-like peptide receptor [Actinia tenebrosa]|uniref:QRFP-like peptide receptor n=1 Tax=Actinia tenebrosa TaxID=6105 RepID=A0A6P8J406_ACTTE|nr:QRFP-like peptide receptor [Actinia tenebrosa]
MQRNNSKSDQDFPVYSINALDIGSAFPFMIIAVIGIIGNSLVISVVRRTRNMHTTTNFLLVNLAAADIVILLWNPRSFGFLIYSVHPRGAVGDLLCELYTGNAIISIALAAAILTLMLLAIERYNALVNTMKQFKITKQTLPFVLKGVWVLAIIISIPDFFENRFNERYQKCLCPFSLELVSKQKIQIASTIICLGILPFFVLSFCYFQILHGLFVTNTICAGNTGVRDNIIKKKLAKLCMTVTIVFYVCFGPYAVFMLYLVTKNRQNIVQDERVFSIILRVFEIFVTLSSSLNPMVYAFQSSSYRIGFKKILRRKTIVKPIILVKIVNQNHE